MIIFKNDIYLNNLALCDTDLSCQGLQRVEANEHKGRSGKREEVFDGNRKDTRAFYCRSESNASNGNLSVVNAPFTHLHNPHGPSHTEYTVLMAPLTPRSRPLLPHLHSPHDFSRHNLMAYLAPPAQPPMTPLTTFAQPPQTLSPHPHGYSCPTCSAQHSRFFLA